MLVKGKIPSPHRKSNTIAPIVQPGQLSGIALGYGLDDRGFEYRYGLGIFLFTNMSRTALGPTHPPIQWVRGLFTWG
jgi:hypothetical protein